MGYTAEQSLVQEQNGPRGPFRTLWERRVILFSGHHGRHIRFRSGNGFDAEFFNQGSGYAR